MSSLLHDIQSVVQFLTSGYALHLAIFVGIYALLGQSFNLVFGLGQLLNLAHVSAYALGAYTAALLAVTPGIEAPFWVCLPASMVVAAAFSLVIGYLAARLEGDYLAVGTLGVSALVYAVLVNWRGLTRGVLGIPGIPRPELFGVKFVELESFLLFVLVIDVFFFAALWFLFNGALGRQLRAQAEHESAVVALGRNAGRARMIAVGVSSAVAGLCGALFSYYMSYIDPSSFGLPEMVFILCIVIVGKPGSFWGVIFGAACLVLLPEPLRFIDFSPEVVGPMRQLLYSVLLFIMVYWRRASLFPAERRV